MNNKKFLNNNDMLSKLNSSDLLDLIVNIINNYYLTLRSKLDFGSNITFGTEIEVENKTSNYSEEVLKNTNYKWIIKEDGSLRNGEEFVSPIFKNSVDSWKEIKKILSEIKKYMVITDRCGGHIHIGAQILGNNLDAWIKLLKIWVTYENVIYRYSAGEYLNNRNRIVKYADSLKWHEKHISSIKKESLTQLIRSYKLIGRHCAINFENVDCDNLNKIKEKNTIEFRTPNGSLNPIIWQNNINTFVHLLLCSKSDKIDMDIVNKRYKINSKIDADINLYNEIYLQDALELCDLIFDKNIDKIYFLRQYLKDFDFVDKNAKSLVLAKDFTK